MGRQLDRREALIALCGFPVLASLSGCDSPAGRKAVKIVIVVAKRLFKIVSVVIDLVELVVDIKAIIDGKEETIQAHINKDEATALNNGGQLVIKGDSGKEFPVEYT